MAGAALGVLYASLWRSYRDYRPVVGGVSVLEALVGLVTLRALRMGEEVARSVSALRRALEALLSARHLHSPGHGGLPKLFPAPRERVMDVRLPDDH
jgi:hypothetical protein